MKKWKKLAWNTLEKIKSALYMFKVLVFEKLTSIYRTITYMYMRHHSTQCL